MSTIKFTRPAADRNISRAAAELFSEFFSSQERELKQYGRAFIEPIFSNNDPYKVVKWVLPHDKDSVEKVEKIFKIFGQDIKVPFLKSYYIEIDHQGRQNKVCYEIPDVSTDLAMESLWQFHELGKLLEPVSIAIRATSHEFKKADIRDSNGQALVGYALAEEFAGIQTGNQVEDAKRNEISSVKRINHATNVLYHVRRAELYRALFNIVSSPDKFERAKELDVLSKLGTDSFIVQDKESNNTNATIVQGFSTVDNIVMPTTEIKVDIDSAIISGATTSSAPINSGVVKPAGTPAGGKLNLKNKAK